MLRSGGLNAATHDFVIGELAGRLASTAELIGFLSDMPRLARADDREVSGLIETRHLTAWDRLCRRPSRGLLDLRPASVYGARIAASRWPPSAAASRSFRHEASSPAIRVYYEDTDFSGVVYHASYLRFMERGRTEQIRALGSNRPSCSTGNATRLRRAAHGDRLAAAGAHGRPPDRRDDAHTVARGASLELRQRVLRGEEELVTADVTVACVGGGRARRIPEALRRRLRLEG